MSKNEDRVDRPAQTDDFAIIESLHQKTSVLPRGFNRRAMFAGVGAVVVAVGVGVFALLGVAGDPNETTEASGPCADLRTAVDRVDIAGLKKVKAPEDVPADLRGQAAESAKEIRNLAIEGDVGEEVSRAMLSTAIAYDMLGAAIFAEDTVALSDAAATVKASSEAVVAMCAE